MTSLSVFSSSKVTSGITFFGWGSSSKQEPFIETARKAFFVILICMAIIGSIVSTAINLQFIAIGTISSGSVLAQLATILASCVMGSVLLTFVDRYFRS